VGEEEKQQCDAAGNATTSDSAAGGEGKGPGPIADGGDEQKKEAAAAVAPDMVAFWKPTLALHIVNHFEAWPRASQLPPFIVEQVGRKEKGEGGKGGGT
jgi:hypothetical protein